MRISAKGANVALHPAQRLALILEPETAVVGRIKGGMRHEAEGTQAVVDRYDDDIAQACEIIQRIDVGGAADISSAVDPYDDRLAVLRDARRRHRDIEIQTILVVAGVGLSKSRYLRTGALILGRIERAGPTSLRHGRGKPEIPDRRQCKRDPLELPHALALDTPQRSRIGVHAQRIGRFRRPGRAYRKAREHEQRPHPAEQFRHRDLDSWVPGQPTLMASAI